MRRRQRRSAPAIDTSQRVPPPAGGRLRPLSRTNVQALCDAAFSILEKTGMAQCPLDLRGRAVAKGAGLREDGRLTFPRALVQDAIARAQTRVNLPGFVAHQGLTIGGGRPHIGTGGAAVQVLDASSMVYRESRLSDLYQLMRIVDQCANIHYGVRPVVARDMLVARALDTNTAFACMKACAKPIGVSFSAAEHLHEVVKIFDAGLGGDGTFARQPFCFAVIVHAVSPLRYAAEGVAVMEAAIDAGMALQICSAAQAGATSPVTLAGALAQGLAESLAGLLIVDLIRPGHPCIFAFMPFISDLRTGAMTGGSGESAIANAAAAQLLGHLGLPSTVSAGMTDAKLADAQAGYEKGYSVALAAQAGADMINLSVGMLGSIMAASPEVLVIDDDMCGAILRTVRGVEVSANSINLDDIEAVATGPGHYLGQAQTLALMKKEYVYPQLSNRLSISAWEEAGAPSLWDRAVARVKELDQNPPAHLPPDREAAIRTAFDIKLPQ